VRSPIRPIAIASTLAISAVLVLSGCTKPAPGATVFAGSASKYQEALCWAFESDALSPGECAQEVITEAVTGEAIATVPVIPGETIGISVDPVVAEAGWFPAIANQRLTANPVKSTYYRFTYPDLQAIPEEGVLLQIVSGQGENTKGIWVFKLAPA